MAGRSSAVDDTATVVRRAPYASTPLVGARGQRAQVRIVEAALQVFGEVGYHACGIQRITEVSGCSRASFYQYFSSKEDVFRHLAGQVAKRLADATAAIDAIGPDGAGRDALFGWLDSHSTIYDDFEPVFMAFQIAAANDEALVSGAGRVAGRTSAMIRDKIHGSPLPEREIDDVVRTLLDTVTRANRVSELLELSAVPSAGLARSRLNRTLADVFHRALFGIDPDVNVRTPSRRRRIRLVAGDLDLSTDPDPSSTLGPAARRTRALLLDRAHDVFAEKGFHATRVADIVGAAGVSHGVFYRYFDNKADIFELLARQAAQHMSTAVDVLPVLILGSAAGSPSTDSESTTSTVIAPRVLRRWLRTYADTYSSGAAIIAMWVEALSRDQLLGPLSVAAVEHSRAMFAEKLEVRHFGDVDAEAIVLLVLMDSMTSQAVTRSRLERYARLIERALLVRLPEAGRRARR